MPEAANSRLMPPSKGTIGEPSPAGATLKPGPPIPGSSAGVCAIPSVHTKKLSRIIGR